MGYYDIMQVCKKGHQINDSFNKHPENNKNFCDKCGSKTINKCLWCNEPIKGDYHVEGVCSFLPTSTPNHCHKCGKPYPWAMRVKISKNICGIRNSLKWTIDKLLKKGN
jgi:hypothetical protein